MEPEAARVDSVPTRSDPDSPRVTPSPRRTHASVPALARFLRSADRRKQAERAARRSPSHLD